MVRLDLSGSFRTPAELEENLLDQFADIAEQAGVVADARTAAVCLRRLIRGLRRHSGQRVVLLVDEYDKPILDALPTPEIARANRDLLHGVYSIIKACDADLEFVLLVGVSRFSKVSIFSGLNNLVDITLDRRYSNLCGYTDDDLDTTFADQLAGLDRQAIRDWYNGYNWLGEEKVYNPYDVLVLFDRREFGAYWFETGTPTYIVDQMLERNVSAVHLDNAVSSDDLLSNFDVEGAATEALLFQSGYLTVRSVGRDGRRPVYRLGYPNREVRLSLTERLLDRLGAKEPLGRARRLQLPNLLRAKDFDGLEAWLRSMFAAIPYQWHTSNNIADYEGYYASVFYALFAAQDFEVVVEDSSSHGRLDMAVLYAGVHLFEFKVVERQAQGQALAQLRDRDYAAKYRNRQWPVTLVGVEFSKETRDVRYCSVRCATGLALGSIGRCRGDFGGQFAQANGLDAAAERNRGSEHCRGCWHGRRTPDPAARPQRRYAPLARYAPGRALSPPPSVAGSEGPAPSPLQRLWPCGRSPRQRGLPHLTRPHQHDGGKDGQVFPQPNFESARNRRLHPCNCGVLLLASVRDGAARIDSAFCDSDSMTNPSQLKPATGWP